MAEAQICVAIKTNGDRCTRRATNEQRCRMHERSLHNTGPHMTALNELKYTQKKAMKELRGRWRARIDAEADRIRQQDLMEDFEHEQETLHVQQGREMDLLRRRQREEVQRNGVDPDAEARERARQRQQQRDEEWRREIDEARARVAREDQADEAVRQRARDMLRDIINRDNQDRAQQLANRELARFAADNQNVHTSQAVNMTKDMVQLILTIPVPEEYRWNMNECSKTPGDIIMTCKLTPKAAWQMSAKYCQDESIYEMGKGIYGKVLDGVWQFILGSPDKADICACLKQEMEDNIGMCAQGNLSRLCNILAGYMEGIGSQESTSEILGRLMPKLMEIEDLPKRLEEAHKILKINRVPESQWESWLSPIVSDQDDEMVVRFLRDDAEQIIGLVAVTV